MKKSTIIIVLIVIASIVLICYKDVLLEYVPATEVDLVDVNYPHTDGYKRFYSTSLDPRDHAFAWQFTVPDDYDRQGIKKIDLYVKWTNEGLDSYYGRKYVGLSKTLTTDRDQWEISRELTDNTGYEYYRTLLEFDEDELFPVNPGETWWIIVDWYSIELIDIYVNYDSPATLYCKTYTSPWDDSPLQPEEYGVAEFHVYAGNNEPFYVDFSYSPDNPKPGDTVQFIDESHEFLIDKWEWTFGDGSFSYEQNPTHIYTEEGEYKVILAGTSVWDTLYEVDRTITVEMNTEPDPEPEPEQPESFDWWWLGLIGLIGAVGLYAFKRRRLI